MRVKKYQSGGKSTTVKDVHDRIRSMRKTHRVNEDGTHSTHLMAHGGNDKEGYYVFPTIFPQDDGSWLDPLSGGDSDENWTRVYEEASKRNEIVRGLSKEMAEDIANGSWKGSVDVPRKTIKFQSGGTISKSAKYYKENPEARKKKGKYDKAYHSTPSRKKYRAELNRKNREAGTYGNGDGKDWDHGVRRMISQSVNRAKDRPTKMQNGGKIPESPKFFRNQMEKNLFNSWYQNKMKEDFNSRPKATGGLKPSYPIFDLAGGLAVKQGVKQGFNLFKSAPSFMEKHGGKVFTVLSAGETMNDFNEMNR